MLLFWVRLNHKQGKRNVKKRISSLNRGYWAIALTTLIWGFHYVVLYEPLRILTPRHFLTLRFGWGAIFLLLLGPRLFSILRGLTMGQWGGLAFLAFLSTISYQISFFKAVSLLDPLSISLILSLGPLLLAVFGHVGAGERYKKSQWGGMLVVFCGTGVLVGGGAPAGVGDFWVTGLLWGALCLFLFVLKTLWSRRLLRTLPPVTVTVLPILIGGLFIALSSPKDLLLAPSQRVPVVYFALFYTICIALYLAYFLWNRALSTLGSTRTSFLVNGQPIVTALGAIGFLGKPLSFHQVFGGILMLSGYGLFFVPEFLDKPIPVEDSLDVVSNRKTMN
uniref:ORF334 n=1 Tax=Leptospirillum ferrooxidans TaxID=180 RepID=Q58KD5_9BACT|nr:DMT family transporter [Leptospirillum ferrooxidans]AAX38535.1 ORF334 [Leptospirillum ferrooxidans]